MSSRAGPCSPPGSGWRPAISQDHLHAWGVKPAGDHGSYLQTVRVLGVKTTSHSTVSVTVNGETRTFADGDGDHVSEEHGRQATVHGRSRGVRRLRPRRARRRPRGLSRQGREGRRGRLAGHERAEEHRSVGRIRRVLSGRSRYATEQLGAAASIGPASDAGGAGRAERRRPAGPAGSAARGGGRGAPLPAADFTTVQRLDTPAAAERDRGRRVLRVSLQPGAASSTTS